MAITIARTRARREGGRGARFLSFSLAALAVFGGATASASPVAAQELQPGYASRCGDLVGFVFSDHPITVHQRPDSASPVLGRVLGRYEGGGDSGGRAPELRILDAHDGWLRILDAHDLAWDGAEPREMYSGLGWVRGEGVSVILQTSKAFATPGHRAPVVLEAPDGGWLNEIGDQVGITDCEDGWVLARWHVTQRPTYPMDGPRPKPERYADSAVVSRDPLIVEGWSTGVCDIQETTCDGVDGDVRQGR